MGGDLLADPVFSGDINHGRWTGGLGGAGLTKDTPETAEKAAAAGQVGVEEKIRLKAKQSDLFPPPSPLLTLLPVCVIFVSLKQKIKVDTVGK